MQEVQETQVRSLALEDPLAKGMVAHSSILACKIPRTEEPGGLQSMGLQSRTRLSDGHFHVGHLHFFSTENVLIVILLRLRKIKSILNILVYNVK